MRLILAALFTLFSIATPAQTGPGRNCISNLGLIPSGVTMYGYPYQQPPLGQTCQMIGLTCQDGLLSGPDLFPTCGGLARNCGSIPDGATRSGFISATMPCIQTSVTCRDGQLSGPTPAPTCAENF